MRLPCRAKNVPHAQMDLKVTKHLPDQYLMEYDTFFRLLSYYLPIKELRDNQAFVSWLRETPGLPDQYASLITYNLPKPRESHYQDDFREMRRKITTKLADLEEFFGYYPV